MIYFGMWGDIVVVLFLSWLGYCKKKDLISVGVWLVLFIGLFMFGIVVFYYWLIFENVVVLLKQMNVFGGNLQFVGFENYWELFVSLDFRLVIGNILFYMVIVLFGILLLVVVVVMIELFGLRFKGLYWIFYFMLYFVMLMVVVQVWKIVYNGQFGLFNQIFWSVGVFDLFYWLVLFGWVLFVVVLFGLWVLIGFNVIILFVGLKLILWELYEVVFIDGVFVW